jgi:hypothetical protein
MEISLAKASASVDELALQSPIIRRLIMEITANTRVSKILEEYGDIADVMELFGVKRVGRYDFRRMLTKALTVKVAAAVHRVPLDEFLGILDKAVATKSKEK